MKIRRNGLTPEALAALQKSESEKWRPVIEARDERRSARTFCGLLPKPRIYGVDSPEMPPRCHLPVIEDDETWGPV
jgi:hypothetical protein